MSHPLFTPTAHALSTPYGGRWSRTRRCSHRSASPTSRRSNAQSRCPHSSALHHPNDNTRATQSDYHTPIKTTQPCLPNKTPEHTPLRRRRRRRPSSAPRRRPVLRLLARRLDEGHTLVRRSCARSGSRGGVCAARGGWKRLVRARSVLGRLCLRGAAAAAVKMLPFCAARKPTLTPALPPTLALALEQYCTRGRGASALARSMFSGCA